MARRRKLYSFWIDPEQASALKVVKTRDGIPESEQIRRAIDAWLNAQGATATRRPARRAPKQRKA